MQYIMYQMFEVEAAMLSLSSDIMKIYVEIIQNVIRNSSYVHVKNGTERIHDYYYDIMDKKL